MKCSKKHRFTDEFNECIPFNSAGLGSFVLWDSNDIQNTCGTLILSNKESFGGSMTIFGIQNGSTAFILNIQEGESIAISISDIDRIHAGCLAPDGQLCKLNVCYKISYDCC
ncbi:S-Ena type endospore appendage [Pontibacillus sp. HMF3514]|uniref:S-Ena type endospore appendage n=1 Tax=Pontibacillus sp. HMF3514 TaxID=2692425 RepID=UPI00131FDCFA|nr:S-Ena type endospore appendage [Pontibacillus sp. HMF3514]QHE51631.1 DUF3992 domain-containing protein [Pontibacillus sp. HMF3514]